MKVRYATSMTIGIGILTTGGSVMASDTLESWGLGMNKTHTPKILTGGTVGRSGCGCIAVSGAGDSDSLDCVKQEAVDLFLSKCRAGTVASAFEPELKALVSNFHRKHVVPFSHNPNEAPPAIDLLIEVVHPLMSQLWITNKTKVRQQSTYATVGVAGDYVKARLDRFKNAAIWQDIGIAAVLAAYGVFLAKRDIEGCGGDTQLVLLRGDMAKYVPHDVVEEMERLFASYEQVGSQALLYCVGTPITLPDKTPRMLALWFRSLRGEISRIVERL